MVCAAHFYYCNVCGLELLPLALVVVETKIYCRRCGEKTIDEMLLIEFRTPGSFDRSLLAHLRMQKKTLRGMRWTAAWSRLFGWKDLPAVR